MKYVVVDIHATLGEVGCIEVALAINESAGRARVAGSVGGSGYGHGMRGRRCFSLGLATVAFHPAIVPSIVENKNVAGLSGASKNSV